MGFVVINHDGKVVVSASSKSVRGCASIEARGRLWALQMAKFCGWHYIIVESDSKLLIDLMLFMGRVGGILLFKPLSIIVWLWRILSTLSFLFCPPWVVMGWPIGWLVGLWVVVIRCGLMMPLHG